MVRKTPSLIIASLVLLAAGVAAANNLLAGPSAGLSVGGGSVVAQAAPSTTGTTTAPTTVGPSTGTPTTTGTTNGTTTGGTATTPPTGVPATTAGALAIDQVVSITRSVAAGTPVNAFTVPAGQQLVITDVLITNPGTAPACGAGVSPSGTTTTTSPAAAATTLTNGTAETGTGVLCVPSQTSLSLGLTTGLEFASGQTVVLANTSTPPATTATLHYHLRGFLMSTSG